MKTCHRMFAVLAGVLFCVVNVEAAVRTWTGTNSASWLDAGNWGGVAPVAGDDLVFPADTARKLTINEYASGTVFNSIVINDAGYTLMGNSITLTTANAITIEPDSLGLVTYNLQTTLTNADAAIALLGVVSVAQSVSILAPLIIAGGNLTFSSVGVLTVNSFINQTATANVQKTGPGTVVFNGASHNYSGTTTVNAGYLRVRGGNLGTANNTAATGTVIASGGTLVLDSFNAINERLVLNGGGQSGTGTVQTLSNSAWGGEVVLNSPGITFNLTGGSLVITGRVTGSGDLSVGRNTLGLHNTFNDYAGSTTIGNPPSPAPGFSNISIGANGVIPDASPVTILDQGGLVLNGFTEVIGSLSGTAQASIYIGTGTLIVGGDNASTTFNGYVNGSASGILGKEGTGTLTLTGSTAIFTGGFAGITSIIDQGAIAVTTSVLSGSTIMPAGQGSISGTGTVGPILIDSGADGDVSPGIGGPGRLAAASLTMGQGNALIIALNGANATTEYDQLAVHGVVSLTNPDLVVTLGYSPVLGVCRTFKSANIDYT